MLKKRPSKKRLPQKKAKRRSPKYVYYYVDLYGVYVVALLGASHDEAASFVKNKYGITMDFSDSNGKFISFHRGTTMHAFIWTDKWSTKPEDIAILSHECLHAALGILAHIGQKVSPKGPNEYLTYLHQAIFQRLWEKRACK